MTQRQGKNNSKSTSRDIVCQRGKIKHLIKQTQQYMTDLTSELEHEYAPFSNNVQPMDCVDRLVSHRIVSKFHVYDSSNDAKLEQTAFAAYTEYDESLPRVLNLWESLTLRKARVLLSTWFRNFKIDLCAIEFVATPGETFISSSGEVSMEAKLWNIKHWTTTYNCLDDTCIFIYNNASFKRAARRHIGVVTRAEKRKLYSRFRAYPDKGFRTFAYLLRTRVLTVVDGARASSVPKSNEKRRFINVEAWFPIILQRAVAQRILKVLRFRGNDLGNFKITFTEDHLGVKNIEHSAQYLHGLMISDRDFCSIDFSNASDSVTLEAVVSLFPKQVSDVLLKYRSQYVAIGDTLHMPWKLSSMGNGFTFEVMTVMLYAIGSTLTPFCRVYGDDVVIPNKVASQFIDTCSLIGFQINEKKTFINSFFRESCGYFYSDFHGYIMSFDFNQINSMSDVVITCNKLTMIIEKGQISPYLHQKLVKTRDLINALVNASRKGPIPVTENLGLRFLSSYIYDKDYGKKQRRLADLASLRKHYIEKNKSWFKGCQLNEKDYSLIYVTFFVPKASKHVFTSTDGVAAILPILYAGRRVKSVIRGKGRWVDLPAFVSSSGAINLVSNIISHGTREGPLSGLISNDLEIKLIPQGR